MKCPWCGSPRARHGETNKFEGFCSQQCLDEHKKEETRGHMDLSSERGYFKMVTEAITRCFADHDKYEKLDDDEHLLDFLSSKTNKIVDIWQDCTDNFTQARLIKQYKKRYAKPVPTSEEIKTQESISWSKDV